MHLNFSKLRKSLINIQEWYILCKVPLSNPAYFHRATVSQVYLNKNW